MAMGRSDAVQGDLMATWAEMPRSPGHAFYDRLQDLLREAGFDAFVGGVCKSYYAPRMGAPSLPPGRHFRMHMIGYFEGIGSERGIARIRSRYGISCGCRTGRKFPTIPGCRKRTRRCSAGC
jgi:transposase